MKMTTEQIVERFLAVLRATEHERY